MRVAEDQLIIQAFDDIVDIESTHLFLHLGVEHNLQQQVAKLLLHVVRIILIDGLQHLIRLLNQVLTQ
ncbi:hypothetical protein D3C75_1176670 [compost metagenome]